MKSSADLVAEGLAEAGVRHLFGYIAGPNARLIEALHGSPSNSSRLPMRPRRGSWPM